MENPQILGAVGVRWKFLKTIELCSKEQQIPTAQKRRLGMTTRGRVVGDRAMWAEKGTGSRGDAGGALGRRHESGSGRLAAAERGRTVVFMSGSHKVKRWIVERCDERYGRR